MHLAICGGASHVVINGCWTLAEMLAALASSTSLNVFCPEALEEAVSHQDILTTVFGQGNGAASDFANSEENTRKPRIRAQQG